MATDTIHSQKPIRNRICGRCLEEVRNTTVNSYSLLTDTDVAEWSLQQRA